jgi:hypothetical protein
VVFERITGFPDEFLLLSNVRAELDEFLLKELIVVAIGVSAVIPSAFLAFT